MTPRDLSAQPAPEPLVPGVTVERDLACRMSDGAALRADVYRPEGTSPRPALLLRLPYGKTAADSDVAFAHPAWLAAQGFVVVVQDTRGRWSSDGEFYPFKYEASDGHATVEWTSALPGCDGRVVTYGFSYPGLIQLLAAARRPRGLVGISPAFTAGQARDGWAYSEPGYPAETLVSGGNAVPAPAGPGEDHPAAGREGQALSGFVPEWALELALDGARRAGDHAAFLLLRGQLATGDAWTWETGVAEAVAKYSGWLADWCDPDGDWNQVVQHTAIDVPALHTGGWWDRFARGTVGNFTALRTQAASTSAREAQRLVMGPWRHMPWSPVPVMTAELEAEPAPAGRDVVDLHLQWWRELLYGEPAPLLRDPVRVWVTGLGWRTFGTWPPHESVTRWYLSSGGRAATRFGDGRLSQEGADPPGSTSAGPPDVLPYDPWLAVPRPGGHGCCLADVTPMGPACQCAVEESPTVLVYTSDPLPAGIVLAGDVTAEIWMAVGARSADVCARLCVVDAAGCSENVLEGIVRAAGAAVPRRHVIDLGPVARHVAAGSRLRLQLSGSDHPLWDLNLTTGEPWSPGRKSFGGMATQVFYHDAAHPSALRLPIAPPG